MVEAAGSGPRSGSHERVEQSEGEFAELCYAALVADPDEQTQRRLLGPVRAPQGSLVREKADDGGSKTGVHPRTSSPLPRATSRNASTATLA